MEGVGQPEPDTGTNAGADGIGRTDDLDESDFLAYFVDPTLLALLFGMLSLPVVALSLDLTDTPDIGRWVGVLGAVLAAALMAGTIGAPLVRADALLGGLLTLVIAWVVAIVALPVLPVLLGCNDGGSLGFGSFCPLAGGNCQAAITASTVTSGLQQVWLFWVAPLVAPAPFAALLLGVIYWSRKVRSWTAERQQAPA
jgi:hypothetical protein